MPSWRKVQMLPPQEQIPIFRAHLERKPKDAAIWFDLGLAYKQIRDWPRCVTANQRALEITGEKGDPAWWNLGIAATAIRDWRLARVAWRGYGLPDIEEGSDPLALNYGSTPVRLPNDEVVWG